MNIDRSEAISKAWADREAARMARAIQSVATLPAHGRSARMVGCTCGWGAEGGKSYRALSAHIGQARRTR
jgi:hypothetical protein